jgi:2-isopropylmalate synthase
VIRVNSQSGKGGVAWVLEQDYGLKLPKKMQADFSRTVQELSDTTGRELTSADIWGAFQDRYFITRAGRFELFDYAENHAGADRIFVGKLKVDGEFRSLSGRGNGLMSSVISALTDHGGPEMDIIDYSEHAIGHGAGAQAAAYVECRTADGRSLFGAGIDTDVATATVRALLSAANGI